MEAKKCFLVDILSSWNIRLFTNNIGNCFVYCGWKLARNGWSVAYIKKLNSKMVKKHLISIIGLGGIVLSFLAVGFLYLNVTENMNVNDFVYQFYLFGYIISVVVLWVGVVKNRQENDILEKIFLFIAAVALLKLILMFVAYFTLIGLLQTSTL